MQLKRGVHIHKLKVQMLLGAIIVSHVYADHGLECIITSGSDGTHMHKSLHYTGLALDFRVRDCPEIERPALVQDLRRALGDEFDVVWKHGKTHIHVEWDPDEGES